MFTHLNEDNQPSMVDVGDKTPTRRTAVARSVVALPPEVVKHFRKNGPTTKKGSVFQTAILAGIMGAKQTSALIPLCHPLALSKVSVDIELNDRDEVVIDCTAKLTGKTGVEMEALTGAAVAALTVYDMCKAFSQDIVIKETRLLEKRGGKTDISRK